MEVTEALAEEDTASAHLVDLTPVLEEGHPLATPAALVHGQGHSEEDRGSTASQVIRQRDHLVMEAHTMADRSADRDHSAARVHTLIPAACIPMVVVLTLHTIMADGVTTATDGHILPGTSIHHFTLPSTTIPLLWDRVDTISLAASTGGTRSLH